MRREGLCGCKVRLWKVCPIKSLPTGYKLALPDEKRLVQELEATREKLSRGRVT